MTIYVVTSGEYSRYHINGVFTDKGKAQRFFDINYAGDQTWTIEEFQADSFKDPHPGRLPFKVLMQVDGTSEVKPSSEFEIKGGDCAVPFQEEPEQHEFFMWAENEKNAVKIANERRLQLTKDTKGTA